MSQCVITLCVTFRGMYLQEVKEEECMRSEGREEEEEEEEEEW